MKTTDYLAIYAAILSTLVFAWNVLQSRPRLKVDLILGIEGSGEALKSGVYIVLRNLSSHDVHISNISILYPYMIPTLKMRLEHLLKFKAHPKRLGLVRSSLSNYSVESNYPLCLEARKSYQLFIPQPTLEAIFADASDRSLIACVQDQLWNNVYSDKLRCFIPNSKQRLKLHTALLARACSLIQTLERSICRKVVLIPVSALVIPPFLLVIGASRTNNLSARLSDSGLILSNWLYMIVPHLLVVLIAIAVSSARRHFLPWCLIALSITVVAFQCWVWWLVPPRESALAWILYFPLATIVVVLVALIALWRRRSKPSLKQMP